MSSTAQTATEIRPLNVSIREDELAGLRRRIAATRWPRPETDASQGVQLVTIQALTALVFTTQYESKLSCRTAPTGSWLHDRR
jgi:hypothetical protein